MKVLTCQRALSKTLMMIFGITPALCFAAPQNGQTGVLMELNWRVGQLHSEQSRWQASFAVSSAGDIARSLNSRSAIIANANDKIENELVAGYFQQRSPHALKWTADSQGNSTAMLYGLPVMAKFSPVLNASESGSGSTTTVLSSGWMWAGAIIVGVAAAAGGGINISGDNGGSHGGGVSGRNSCGTNGGTVVGNGGAVNTDDPSDPSGGPSVDTGCVN